MNTTLTPLAASIERAQAALDRKAADAHARPREMQAALRATLADAPAPAPAKAIKGERVFYARWTSAERGRVAQLYKAGTPLHDIAAVIGRTERAVCAMATRLRVEGAL